MGELWISLFTGRDPSVRLNMPLIVKAAQVSATRAYRIEHNAEPSDEQVADFARTPLIRAVLFADENHLMPQTWLAGLLDTYATTLSRAGYLHGEISSVGWWYYFPLTFFYKTPTATLVAIALAIAFAIIVRKHGLGVDRWSLICILSPMIIYGVCAMRSNTNLGLRHIFPIYPFVYVLIAIAAARAWSMWPRVLPAIGAILSIGLIIESLAAYPNYIAFFNGSRNGIDLLGDSNLDWGQDLLLLSEWRKSHPEKKLYVSYFGMADPVYYMKCSALPGNASPFEKQDVPHEPGIAAISATNLQGIYLQPADREMYRELFKNQQPIEVLGKTIYLFEVTGR